MRYFYSIVIMFILFLFGCSTPTGLISDEYKNEKFSDVSLTVVKLYEDPVITNTEDVTDDLGTGVPSEVYNSFFKENFMRSLRNSNCFSQIKFIERSSIKDLEEKTLDISSKEKMKILLPISNTITSDSISTDFVLFIDKLQVSRNTSSSQVMVNEIFTTRSSEELYHKLYFAIWDNQKGNIVSFGRAEESTPFPLGMTKEDWVFVVRGLTRKILDYSPFQSIYLNNY